MLLLHTAHHHAEVACFDHHSHSDWLDSLLDCVGDLFREPFLNLQTAREDIDQPWDLAQADHASFRQIRNVDLAEERQHVVFAEAEYFDVFDDDHLIVIDIKQRAAQELGWIFLVAARQELDGFSNALGSAFQAVAIRIFADILQHLQIRLLQLRLRSLCSVACSLRHRHHTLHCCCLQSNSFHDEAWSRPPPAGCLVASTTHAVMLLLATDPQNPGEGAWLHVYSLPNSLPPAYSNEFIIVSSIRTFSTLANRKRSRKR